MANARTLALVSGAAVLGIGAFLYFAGGSRRASDVARGTGGPTPSASEDARPELSPLPVLPPEDARPARSTAPEPERRADSTAGASGSSLLVEVVEKATGRAVPGAEVLFADHDGEELPDLDIDLVGLEMSVEGAGGFSGGKVSLQPRMGKVTADENGLARIPVTPERSVQVLARAEGLLGRAVFAPADPADRERERERIELLSDWDLEVEVQTASGAPASEVPVVLSGGSSSWSSSTGSTTDASGRARFAHAGFRIAEAPELSWSAGVDLPLGTPLVRALDPAERPRAPLVFRLPPLGAALVSVLEADGGPAEDGTQVQLGIVRPGEPRDVSPFASERRARTSKSTVAGKAVFELVELGGELEILANHQGQNAVTREYFPGPQRAGERVPCTLVLGLDHPVLVLRAVDVEGKPLVREELQLDGWTRTTYTSNRENRTTRTDEHGGFRIDVPGKWSEGDVSRTIVRARKGEIGALLDLARAFEPGLNALGDLVLAPAPLLVAGRVVDDRGAPVEGARVSVQVALEEQGGQPSQWEALELEESPETDGAGAFTVRGFAFGDELLLTPQRGSERGDPVRSPAGARGIELLLVRTGEVAGRVLLDPGVPREEIDLTLRRDGLEEVDDLPWEGGHARPGEDGAFRIASLLPGTYRLEVGLEDGVVLEEVPQVEVIAGETSRDPRLTAIDLRGKLFTYRFELVTPEEGSELRGSMTFGPTGDEDEAMRWHYFQGSSLVIVTPHRPIDALFTVSGYRTVFLGEVSGDREVVLRPAIGVRLVLPADVELPEPPYYIKAALVKEDSSLGIDWGASAFDETRVSYCRVADAGRLKVQWLLERRSGNGASATTIELEPEQFIDVQDVEGQLFELHVSREALARVLANPPF